MRYSLLVSAVVVCSCSYDPPVKTVDKVFGCTTAAFMNPSFCRVQFSDGTRGDVLAPVASGDCVVYSQRWHRTWETCK